MATVYQRSKELNANLTRSQLCRLGHLVNIAFKTSTDFRGSRADRTKVPVSKAKFKVWDYSDNFTPVIDSCIEAILKPPPEPEPVIEKPKRKRISASKVKIDG